MNQSTTIKILSNWSIPFRGFCKYAGYFGINARSITDPIYLEENDSKLYNLIKDYINLRLSFYAIHDERLSDQMTYLYQRDDMFYPTKDACVDFQSIIKYGIALNGIPTKTIDRLVEAAQREMEENNMQWFTDKYSEKPVEFVTDVDNAEVQLKQFKEQLQQGNIYHHYRINQICFQNNFDLRSAYRYLRHEDRTLEGYVSAILAITFMKNKPLSTAYKKDFMLIGDLVFSGVGEVKSYYSKITHVMTQFEYQNTYGTSEGYSEFALEQIKKEFPNTKKEFVLESLILPDNPEQPIDPEVLENCRKEITNRYYGGGIIFNGKLYQSVDDIKHSHRNYIMNKETLQFINNISESAGQIVDADQLVQNKGLEIVKTKNSLTIKKKEEPEVITPKTNRGKLKEDKEAGNQKPNKPSTPNRLKPKNLARVKKLDTPTDEYNFIDEVNTTIAKLGINHMDFADFIFQFEGQQFHKVKVSEEMSVYHNILEIYTNLLIDYLVKIDKIAFYKSSLTLETLKELSITKVIQSAFILGVLNKNFPIYVNYGDLTKKEFNILEWVAKYKS